MAEPKTIPQTAVSVDAFLRATLRSGILDRPALQAALGTVAVQIRKDPEALAEELIRQGKLTRFQAGKLLRGMSLGLILGPYQVLAPLDAEHERRSQEWAKVRCDALKEFQASEEGKAMQSDAYAYYNHLLGICGGDTWWRLFSGGYGQHVVEFMTKNCAAGVAKRNHKIATKLDNAGVTAVTSSDYTRTSDGFDGFFAVATDKGPKAVTIQTIYAGGYNIQCLHVRVLVNVR